MDLPPLIMVVDDEWVNRELLESYLQHFNYRVMLAHNGEEALKLAEATPPDVAVIDIRLPGMNGYEVCRQLKQSARAKKPYVILISGLSAEEEMRTAGADDFIDRVYLTTELAKRIERLIGSNA